MSSESVEDFAIDTCNGVFVRVSGTGKGEFEHKDAGGIEAGIYPEQMEKCADQQTGGDDEN